MIAKGYNIEPKLIDYLNLYQAGREQRIDGYGTGGGCDYLVRILDNDLHVVIAAACQDSMPDTLEEACCITIYDNAAWLHGVTVASGNFMETVKLVYDMDSIDCAGSVYKKRALKLGSPKLEPVLKALQEFEEIGVAETCGEYRRIMFKISDYVSQSALNSCHDFDTDKWAAFQASRTWYSNLYTIVSGNPDLENQCGYYYPASAAYLQLNKNTGRYFCDIENHGTNTASLLECEIYLFEHWAQFEMDDNRIPEFNFNNVTPASCDAWIVKLHAAGLLYHFDDNPRSIGNTVNGAWIKTFNISECRTLDRIMPAMFSTKYDPFEICVDLANK